jgi:putative endonuclease
LDQDRSYWVYILASKIGGTLYIGVTNDLVRRVYEHRAHLIAGFTSKYGVHRLVYFESFSDIENAIRREKQLKKWNRAGKFDSSKSRILIGLTFILPSPAGDAPNVIIRESG